MYTARPRVVYHLLLQIGTHQIHLPHAYSLCPQIFQCTKITLKPNFDPVLEIKRQGGGGDSTYSHVGEVETKNGYITIQLTILSTTPNYPHILHGATRVFLKASFLCGRLHLSMSEGGGCFSLPPGLVQAPQSGSVWSGSSPASL